MKSKERLKGRSPVGIAPEWDIRASASSLPALMSVGEAAAKLVSLLPHFDTFPVEWVDSAEIRRAWQELEDRVNVARNRDVNRIFRRAVLARHRYILSEEVWGELDYPEVKARYGLMVHTLNWLAMMAKEDIWVCRPTK